MKNHAFTLIELLVVVLIIGILTSVALPQYQKAVAKARATQYIGLINSLKTALTSHTLANGFVEKIFYRASKGTVDTNALDELDISVPVTAKMTQEFLAFGCDEEDEICTLFIASDGKSGFDLTYDMIAKNLADISGRCEGYDTEGKTICQVLASTYSDITLYSKS